MNLEGVRIGFAVTGSFCTFSKILPEMVRLVLSLIHIFARTLIGTVTSVLFTGIIAYALAHKDLVFRNFYFTILIIAMYVGGGVIPTFLLYKNIGLYDTFWVYVIPSLFGVWKDVYKRQTLSPTMEKNVT